MLELWIQGALHLAAVFILKIKGHLHKMAKNRVKFTYVLIKVYILLHVTKQSKSAGI